MKRNRYFLYMFSSCKNQNKIKYFIAVFSFQPARGRGGPPFRAARGGLPVGRGARGARGGRGGVPARGGRGGTGPQKAVRGGKRKAGADFSQGQSKRRVVSDNWGAQPIAQQPLDQSSYGGGYTGNDAQWYQDSYGGNW